MLVRDHDRDSAEAPEHGAPDVRAEHVGVHDVHAVPQERDEGTPGQEVEPRPAPEREHPDPGLLELAVEQRLVGLPGGAEHALEAGRVELHRHDRREALGPTRHRGLVDQRENAQLAHGRSFTMRA